MRSVSFAPVFFFFFLRSASTALHVDIGPSLRAGFGWENRVGWSRYENRRASDNPTVEPKSSVNKGFSGFLSHD